MGIKVLVTGRLVSNSISSLVLPLAALQEVDSMTFVADKPGPPMPKLTYRCPSHISQRVLGRALAKLLVMAEIAVTQKPDLVIGFNLFPHGINACITARLARTRFIISIIGSKTSIEGGGYKSSNRYLSYGGIKKPWLEAVFVELLRRADLVTVMGRNTQRYLESKGINRVAVLPVCVDLNHFYPGMHERDIDAISVSSLIPRKRVDLFVRSFALAAKKDRRTGIVLGEGPLRDEIEQLARRLGVADNVRFLGFRENLEDYVRNSKCLVMPSEAEGLSLSMLFAMACGTVPIVRDVGDLTDAAHNGVTAFVVSEPTVQCIADALVELWSNEELRSGLSRSAVEYIRDNYSLQESTRRWKRIIQDRL